MSSSSHASSASPDARDAAIGTVAWITFAPVKALGLVRRDEVRIERSGVALDRRFVLVDSRAELVNGKRAPGLSTVLPDIDGAAETLTLRFRDGTVVNGPVDVEPSLVDVRIFGRVVPARVVRGEFSAVLSASAGLDVRLVRLERPGDGVDRPNGGATILSVAALDGLASEAGLSERVDERRFRMLFGVDGVPAHAEDRWLGRRVRFGDAVLVPDGNVGRCVVTTRHPDTAELDLDTLRLLAEYRGDEPTTEPLPFGVWAHVDVPGVVRVGDPVVVEGLTSV